MADRHEMEAVSTALFESSVKSLKRVSRTVVFLTRLKPQCKGDYFTAAANCSELGTPCH
jgi:hypothetical protein